MKLTNTMEREIRNKNIVLKIINLVNLRNDYNQLKIPYEKMQIFEKMIRLYLPSGFNNDKCYDQMKKLIKEIIFQNMDGIIII